MSAHAPQCLLSKVDDGDWNQRTAEAHGLPTCTCNAPPSTDDLCGLCFGGGCPTCAGSGLLPVGHASSLTVRDASAGGDLGGDGAVMSPIAEAKRTARPWVSCPGCAGLCGDGYGGRGMVQL